MEVKEIGLDQIFVSEFNTRKDLQSGTEDAGLQDLADSIRERGLLNPITVNARTDGKYDLIAGQRRFMAYQRLGQMSIPCIIREELDDVDATVVSLIENVHRADMNPIDKARAYQRLYESLGSYSLVAKQANVSVTTVTRYLRLLNLTPSLQDKLSTAEGPAGIGAMSRLGEVFSPDQQEEAIKKIGGFKQDIQEEMIRRSGGDLDSLAGLRDEAMEGHFNTRLCREGLCFRMPPELKAEVLESLGDGNDS